MWLPPATWVSGQFYLKTEISLTDIEKFVIMWVLPSMLYDVLQDLSCYLEESGFWRRIETTKS